MITENDHVCINIRSSLSVHIAEYKLQKEAYFKAELLTSVD